MMEQEEVLGRPLPEIDEDTAPYWEACREGRLILQRCRGCDLLQSYPRERCSACWGRSLAWEDACGRATVYSFSVVHRPPPGFEGEAPYVLAIVELEEGIRMMTNVIGCDPAEVRIGMLLTVEFRDVGGGTVLPMFVPA